MGERAPLSQVRLATCKAQVLSPALLSFALLACGDKTPAPSPESSGTGTAESTPVEAPNREQPVPRLPRTTVIETLVAFPQAPEHPQRMIATFTGDRRARLWFGTLEPNSPERRLIYRNEEGLYVIQSRSSESTEVPAVETAQLVAQLELRRAAFLWPEEFTWTADGDSYVTPLASGGQIRAQFKDPVTGNASTDPSRPVAFQSELSANGPPTERYRDLVWSEAKRLTALRLYVGDRRIWDEKLESYDARARFLSSYFTPADRRRGSSGLGEAMVEGALRLELPERVLLRAPMTAMVQKAESAPQTLAEARLLCIERIREWKLPLEPGYAIEFDSATHRPSALLLWPKEIGAPILPLGVIRGLRKNRAAVALLLTRQEVSDHAQSLPQIRAQFPENAEPEAHYEVHFGGGDTELDDDRAQLIWGYQGS